MLVVAAATTAFSANLFNWTVAPEGMLAGHTAVNVTELAPGVLYRCLVRAINSAGIVYVSDYNNHKIRNEITNLSADQDWVVGKLSRQGLQAAGQIHSGADHCVFQTIF